MAFLLLHNYTDFIPIYISSFLYLIFFFMQQLNFSLNTQKSQYIQKILAFYS